MYISVVDLSGKRKRYFIEERIGSNHSPLAWFDTLEDAGIAFRYLNGSTMRGEDQAQAICLLRQFDARMAHNAPEQEGDA